MAQTKIIKKPRQGGQAVEVGVRTDGDLFPGLPDQSQRGSQGGFLVLEVFDSETRREVQGRHTSTTRATVNTCFTALAKCS